MPQFSITFEVPDIARELLTTSDLNPFESSMSVKVDRDNLTRLLQELLQEVRYQKQRDEETFIGLSKLGL